jgi:hypothetical protein
MKIIQILAGQDGDDHVLYGLSDDGSLYEFNYATEPKKVAVSAGHSKGRISREPARFSTPVTPLKDPNSVAARDMLEAIADPQPAEYKFRDGSTLGWKLVCSPGVMAKPVPHADDPSRCERC